MSFRIVGSRLRANLDFVVAESLEVRSDTGEAFERLVIRHPGAAAIVLFHEGDVVLIRQYRAPIDDYLLEIPAGKLEPGEDPRVTAEREAAEEAGCEPGEMRHLASIHTGPGFTDEVIHLYLGTDLRFVTPRPEGPEEHDADVVRLPFIEALDLIDHGHITDSKTVSGLLLAREVLE